MCERFSVQIDFCLFQSTDEFAVGILFVDIAECGVYFDIPETAKVTLFIAAMGKSVSTSMRNGLISGALGL